MYSVVVKVGTLVMDETEVDSSSDSIEGAMEVLRGRVTLGLPGPL